jgi:hypothetical protein
MIENERIIVSMTSYPKRITNVAKAIYFLMTKQTLKPDEIHLWLSTEEFPNKEKDLPQDLQRILEVDAAIIHWLPKNTYVHKRHEYFKIAHENDLVFLIDDDVRYDDNLIETVVNTHKKFDSCIICYNRYPEHIYKGKKIIYGPSIAETVPLVNKNRWCGQSMIPAKLYPKECLSEENQAIRDKVDPISDECWFQPWTVYNDIPILHLNYGWGKDLDKNNSKWQGIVSWSHQVEANGLERRDNWLYGVLSSIPKLLDKYKRLFNYGN